MRMCLMALLSFLSIPRISTPVFDFFVLQLTSSASLFFIWWVSMKEL